MTNEERDNLLLAIVARLDKMDARLDEMNARLDEMNARLDEMNARLDEMNARLDEIYARLDEIYARLENLETQMKQVQKSIRGIKGILEDHDDKLKMLLETTTKRTEDSTELNQMLESHEDQLYNHDIRIRVLESNVKKSKVGNL